MLIHVHHPKSTLRDFRVCGAVGSLEDVTYEQALTTKLDLCPDCEWYVEQRERERDLQRSRWSFAFGGPK